MEPQENAIGIQTIAQKTRSYLPETSKSNDCYTKGESGWGIVNDTTTVQIVWRGKEILE